MGQAFARLEPLESRILLATDFTAVWSTPGDQASWIDYDLDGWTDLATPSGLYRNDQGEFVQVLTQNFEGTWGDFNNDGYPDFYNYPNHRLLQNNTTGGFHNASHMLPEFPDGFAVPRGAVWGDFNGDGFLDLYIGAYESWPTAYYTDVMLLNEGGESFSVQWQQNRDAVVTDGRPRPARGVTTIDFDEDNDLDIYVSNYRLEPNALWQNDGSANVTDVAGATNTTGGHGHSIGSAVGDMNNDGHINPVRPSICSPQAGV